MTCANKSSKRISFLLNAAFAKLGIQPSDAAQYLQSDGDCAAYLQACLEQGPDNAELFTKAIGDIACARGMIQLAKHPRRVLLVSQRTRHRHN